MCSFPQTLNLALVLYLKSCRWPPLGLSPPLWEGLQLGRCSAPAAIGVCRSEVPAGLAGVSIAPQPCRSSFHSCWVLVS